MSAMKARKLYVDYNQISLRLEAMSGEIRHKQFDAIVIVLRGGSFAGIHLAHLTGLPYSFLKYDRRKRKATWVGPVPKGNRILLSEDFAGSGNTLIDCKKFLTDGGYEVSTFVICQDHLSASIPDFCCFDGKRTNTSYLLPWERHILAVEKFDGRPDYLYNRTGWDLDGVFLKDIPGSFYREDLEATLKLRDDYPIADFAPSVSERDIIITGRPETDRMRTEMWLKKHGIQLPIFLRDDDIEVPSHQSTAHWKGRAALDLGCTHFVESEAEQALYIANLYPELRVVWWNEGKPVAINASESFRSNLDNSFIKSTTETVAMSGVTRSVGV